MEKIAVIGLGFVGLPLSLTYTLHGIKVYGIDINKEYVEKLKNVDAEHLQLKIVHKPMKSWYED